MNPHNQTDDLSFKPNDFPVARAIDIVGSISYSDGSVVSRTLKNTQRSWSMKAKRLLSVDTSASRKYGVHALDCT
ncbi:MAG: hypothetical protein MPEBLZ_01125 [Candidatus Methanoperedens nitroreducens]|uniref:Uncharacterized protein n=1 Tax=Candidatus Methanoperedens nitratireducens TaxID=1392998 RepID=A0A0P8A7X6_9EURY|nr:hypothetical protein [Candidatus Methanoperedens sp. BLZ2]KAB2946975.1 MAG: hypothetical protein F9K14_05940 [Candidatus Methanoperedens sp.]KPQ44265.1 MAG: hypothetical protein MPEBLZ_01125 [Candidatus Methanoperedens sp. BLZ1]MBZ0176777.1 hypothetical protein [Candidatus Methanoperedens nitroreducens]MCX9080499.1 hypothetical protein [Candidatus Methanoperedens sp.]